MLREMSAEEFERHKTALAVRRLEKPKQLTDRASRYWAEMTKGRYQFDRDEVEVEELKSIRLSDLLDFFESHVFQQATKRRKIAVHVVSGKVTAEKAGCVAADSTRSQTAQLIKEVAHFKRGLSLFPVLYGAPPNQN